jgi:N-formylglutamate amidohydrolase
MDFAAEPDDSARQFGGSIPGLYGRGAFWYRLEAPSSSPVLIAVPHAGRTYPANLLERMHNPGFATLRLEDRFVDMVAREVARRTGAGVLVADAPRAMIDLNRAPDDVDWTMFSELRGHGQVRQANGRSRNGLGLIPRRLAGYGDIWKDRHRPHELAARIAGIHQPYHGVLDESLGLIRAHWGAALLVDLHSMPPLPTQPGQPPVSVVLGDRFGATCHGRLVAAAFAQLAEARTTVAHNRPYAGGYVLERHGRPADGVHALQIEIDRRLYLDAALDGPGPGMEATISMVTNLIRRLADETAQLRLNVHAPDQKPAWAEAAE